MYICMYVYIYIQIYFGVSGPAYLSAVLIFSYQVTLGNNNPAKCSQIPDLQIGEIQWSGYFLSQFWGSCICNHRSTIDNRNAPIPFAHIHHVVTFLSLPSLSLLLHHLKVTCKYHAPDL